MADENQPSRQEPALPVPDLIEQYRVRRQEWMAQADELARLRDEVRGSAEREAMEIVTAARRDIRKIVIEARRELFVLSAQVQAAVGDAPLGAAQTRGALPLPGDEIEAADDLSSFAEEEWGFAPRATVRSVLDEARADMAILDQDARAVQARPAPAASSPERSDSSPESPVVSPEFRVANPESPVPSFGPRIPSSPSAVSSPESPVLSPEFQSLDFGVSNERTSRRSIIQFSAFTLAAATVVVLATAWSLRSPETRPEAAVPPIDETGAGAEADAASPPAGSAAALAAAGEPSAPIRLAVEATRPAWIRAIVDGQADAGQMLRAGDTYEVRGTTSISLRVGDAGAVLVSVNGGEARALGRDGQVVNRRFTPDGAAPGEAPPPAGPPPAAAPGTPAVPDTRLEPPPIPASPSPLAAAAAPDATAPAEPVVVATNGGDNAPVRSEAEPRPPSASPPDSALVYAAQQWLDAYHRQDRSAIASLSTPDVTIVDERPTEERFPAAAGGVARSFERLTVRMAADTAVLTGVMVERAVNGGLQRSSPVSLMWIANAGAWRLTQARLVSESRLSQIFR